MSSIEICLVIGFLGYAANLFTFLAILDSNISSTKADRIMATVGGLFPWLSFVYMVLKALIEWINKGN